MAEENLLKEEKKWANLLRLTFLLLTAILGGIILVPIMLEYQNFPYLGSNILFIILCGYMAFLLFFPKRSWMARNKWSKIIFVLLLPLLFFSMYNTITEFNFYLDRNMIRDDLAHLKFRRQDWLSNYVRNEYLFTGIFAIISTVLVGLNFIRLIWIQINKNKNVSTGRI